LFQATHCRCQLLLRQLAAHAAFELRLPCRWHLVELIAPGLVRGLAGSADAAPHLAHIGRHLDGSLGPTEALACALYLGGAARRAVRLPAACLRRRSVTNGGAAGD